MAKKTILVVDDEKDMCDILYMYFKRIGIETKVAYNGKEALGFIKKKKPDLILLDVLMPKMDGFETLRYLKSNPAYSNIPVIMLTAKAEPYNLDKGIELGADFYLPKPFSLKNLKEFINISLGENSR